MKITEDQLQAQCVEWFRLQYPGRIIFAIPNGGSRNKIEAAKLKRCGVLAGMPDLCIPCVVSPIHRFLNAPGPLMNFVKGGFSTSPGIIEVADKIGLYIELKVGKNKLTKNQQMVVEKLMCEGYLFEVCYTFEEFQGAVKEYFGG